MVKPKNTGKQWSDNDVQQLKKLVKQNTPTPLLAYKLERTEDAVRAEANKLNVSLKPTNKSPYNRQK